MGDDGDRSILVTIATQLGALDSKLDAAHQELKEHKNQYNNNAIAARDHANFMTQELSHKMDKRDYPFTNKVESTAKNWAFILILVSIAIAIGVLKWGDGAKGVMQAKDKLESTIKGKPSK